MGALDGLKRYVDRRLGIGRVAATADQAAAGVTHLERAVADAIGRQHQHDARIGSVEQRRDTVIGGATTWAALAPLRHRPTIDVVMPTRNRSALVGTAIESVLAQTYPVRRLIVVDDGSTDGTAELLSRLAHDEPSVQVVRTEGIGAAAARNRALAVAEAQWVAFLDDDNVMHPGWLRAVVEHTGRNPDCSAVFGAQLREDVLGGDEVPWLLFTPDVDTERLRLDNTIDMNVLVVRRDHPELHFDESFDLYIDWEMIERIFTVTPIQPIPVVAGLYTLAAPTRITDRHSDDNLARMRAFFAARR